MIPIISVLMPVYNGEKYLKKAIDSVLIQTFKNLELIIIDDGSTDDSFNIINSFSDSRIVYLKNEINLGIVKSLNKGLSICKGEYIARMDADDICYPERFEKQINYLLKNKNIGFCGANLVLIDIDDKKLNKINYPQTSADFGLNILFRSPIAHPLAMIRKSIFDQANGYRSGIEPAEDFELFMRFLKFTKGINLPETLLEYRIHSTNYSKIKREKYESLMTEIFHENAHFLEIDKKFISYHVKSIVGCWNIKTSAAEIKGFKEWKKSLLESKKYDKIAMNTLANYYISIALLSILKSPENDVKIKIKAFVSIFQYNPIAVFQYVLSKF